MPGKSPGVRQTRCLLLTRLRGRYSIKIIYFGYERLKWLFFGGSKPKRIFGAVGFYLSVSLQWDLVCDHKKLNQALATYFFLGVTLGAVVFGQLSDR